MRSSLSLFQAEELSQLLSFGPCLLSCPILSTLDVSPGLNEGDRPPPDPLALPNTPQGAAGPFFVFPERTVLASSRSLGALPAQPLSMGLFFPRLVFPVELSSMLLLQAAEVPLDGSTALCFSTPCFFSISLRWRKVICEASDISCSFASSIIE